MLLADELKFFFSVETGEKLSLWSLTRVSRKKTVKKWEEKKNILLKSLRHSIFFFLLLIHSPKKCDFTAYISSFDVYASVGSNTISVGLEGVAMNLSSSNGKKTGRANISQIVAMGRGEALPRIRPLNVSCYLLFSYRFHLCVCVGAFFADTIELDSAVFCRTIGFRGIHFPCAITWKPLFGSQMHRLTSTSTEKQVISTPRTTEANSQRVQGIEVITNS